MIGFNYQLNLSCDEFPKQTILDMINNNKDKFVNYQELVDAIESNSFIDNGLKQDIATLSKIFPGEVFTCFDSSWNKVLIIINGKVTFNDLRTCSSDIYYLVINKGEE